MSLDYGPESGIACQSCGTHMADDYSCPKCNVIHDKLGNITSEEDVGRELPMEVYNLLRGYEIGYIGKIVIPKSKWGKQIISDVSIEKIEGMQGRFHRLFIKLGGSQIKLETNGTIIKNYMRKTRTKNGRGKGYKWVKGTPAPLVKEFLEKKLRAKFAQS